MLADGGKTPPAEARATELNAGGRVFAERAATIDERMSAAFAPFPGGRSSVEIACSRLAAWCSASAGGDWQLFERRLSMDGLGLSEALTRLGHGQLSEEHPSLRWIGQAQWIYAAIDQPCPPDLMVKLATAGQTPPFVEIIGGLVSLGLGLVEQGLTEPPPGHLTDGAWATLAGELAGKISELCAPHLWEKFSKVPMNGGGSGPPRSYRRFVVRMRTGGFRDMLDERPVLARLIATLVSQWIDATVEFLNRLAKDRGMVASSASDRMEFTAELGDPHNGGRCVRLAVFADGRRVIYKPRDVRIDGAWANLIDHLNRSGAPEQLRTPLTTVRSGYGWAEFIDHAPCRTAGDAQTFVRRAGAWLCLLHLFRATDMHEENVIASGPDPVPVDLETLLQSAQVPEVDPSNPNFGYAAAGRIISNSVLATGLLPTYGKDPRAPTMHGGLVDVPNRTRRIRWIDLNTDSMRPAAEVTESAPPSNQPRLDGVRLDVRDHVESLVDGYTQYGHFLLEVVKAEGLESLLKPFLGLPVRKLLRNTRFYSLLLDRARGSANMVDGGSWSAQMDFVSRLADWTQEQDSWWPLFRAERDALVNLDVPHFLMRTDSSSIKEAASEEWESDLEDGISRAHCLFAAFGKSALEEQVDIIRLALSRVRTIEQSTAIRGKRRLVAQVPTAGSQQKTFEQAVDDIAESIMSAAIEGETSAAWIGLDWLRDSDVCQLAPLGGDIYNGAPGVSLFLACHARTLGANRSAALARKGIAALREDLLGMGRGRAARALGPGGSSGLGSVVYAFTAISTLLHDRKLLQDTVQISELLTPRQFPETAGFDVMDGAGGAVLGLLALWQATGHERVLEQVRPWIGPLIEGHLHFAKISDSGAASSALTGMSHGAAGLIMTMLALAERIDGDDQIALIEKASACLAWEDALFSTSCGNWPDLRYQDARADRIWPCQWCHGAAGIGLARVRAAKSAHRIAMSTSSGADLARNLQFSLGQGVERAVSSVEASWPYPTDSLCCGSLGGIELLGAAAGFLGRPRLSQLASDRLAEIVAEARGCGGYQWDIGDERYNIGLFRGLAGVGLTLLRRLDESSLPNVLTWS